MTSPMILPSDPATPPTSPTSPSPAASNLPRPSRWKGRSKLIITILAIVLVPLLSGAAWYLWLGGNSHRADLIFHKVQRERLDLTIVERGAMESAYNNDVNCRVKSGQKGGGYATTIKWIIDDGSLVKEG